MFGLETKTMNFGMPNPSLHVNLGEIIAFCLLNDFQCHLNPTQVLRGLILNVTSLRSQPLHQGTVWGRPEPTPIRRAGTPQMLQPVFPAASRVLHPEGQTRRVSLSHLALHP